MRKAERLLGYSEWAERERWRGGISMAEWRHRRGGEGV